MFSILFVIYFSCYIYFSTNIFVLEANFSRYALLARDAQAKLALIVAQSIHLSICVSIYVSVRDSLGHAYVRSIARREPRRLPACKSTFYFLFTRDSRNCYSASLPSQFCPSVRPSVCHTGGSGKNGAS